MEKLKNYQYLGKDPAVCGGRVVVYGTRIEPRFVVTVGLKQEAMEDFNLNLDQVEDCYTYVRNEYRKKKYKDLAGKAMTNGESVEELIRFSNREENW